MQNFSNATIEGFVTHDPQAKTTKTGKSLCTFALAINHYTRNDEPPQVSFINVETWEKTAEFCSRNITKGRRILVTGSLRQDRWEDDNGKMQSRIKIIGNEIVFLGAPKTAEETAPQPQQP
ncbi:MAG: single-stranded DNA-binding protein [Spirochaetae bacterium HGW-Spirochaetae-5]|jgi:single-strand DNA-binding protein|nr:MAG: single-stranded DNA-binding protein [Spirochaetae bacterium HGW-Spirochaetae-5]